MKEVAEWAVDIEADAQYDLLCGEYHRAFDDDGQYDEKTCLAIRAEASPLRFTMLHPDFNPDEGGDKGALSNVDWVYHRECSTRDVGGN